jgi:hypothetical protein
VPSPPFCTIDPVLVGTASGHPVQGASTAQPGFRVIVRDILNFPVAHAYVSLDFSAAGGPRGIADGGAGTIVDCVARTISRVADDQGVAVFAPRFGGYDNANSVDVLADGVLLARVPCRSTDVDGVDGLTGLGDFARLSAGFVPCPGCPPCASCPELDFDGSGGPIRLNDFAIFAREFMRDMPPAPYCW